MTEKFLAPEDVVRITGLSKSTIYRAIDDGELRAAKIRRRILIRPADFDAWFEANLIAKASCVPEPRPRLRPVSENEGLRRMLRSIEQEASDERE